MINKLRVGLIAAALFSAVSLNAEEKVIFKDDFNREDSNKVDKGWKVKAGENSNVLLEDNAALFITTDEPGQPLLSHKFAEQAKGKFSVSFVMDWTRDYESDWGFYMQLGSSKKMSDDADAISKGTSVNLVWGGGISIDREDVAVFGYVKEDKVTVLTRLNDNEDEKTVVEKATVKIDVDMDSKTYSLTLNGKVHKSIKFTGDSPIDTIRFIAHNCNPDNFPKSSIDDVKITKK